MANESRSEIAARLASKQVHDEQPELPDSEALDLALRRSPQIYAEAIAETARPANNTPVVASTHRTFAELSAAKAARELRGRRPDLSDARALDELLRAEPQRYADYINESARGLYAS